MSLNDEGESAVAYGKLAFASSVWIYRATGRVELVWADPASSIVHSTGDRISRAPRVRHPPAYGGQHRSNCAPPLSRRPSGPNRSSVSGSPEWLFAVPDRSHALHHL